jgi:hypothetical protein
MLNFSMDGCSWSRRVSAVYISIGIGFIEVFGRLAFNIDLIC